MVNIYARSHAGLNIQCKIKIVNYSCCHKHCVTQKVNNRQELYAKIGQELTTNFFCLSNVTIASIMFLKKGRNQSLKTGVVKDLMFKDNKKCNVRYHHTFFALTLFSVYAHKIIWSLQQTKYRK